MQTFDMILIGTGAGLSVSASAAVHGMKVAVIEEGPFGGVCVNRGCIPSKMLIRSADVKELVDKAHLWGVDAQVKGIDWEYIVGHVAETIDGYSSETEKGNEQNENISVFRGRARFVGEKTLEVNGDQLTAETIIIAAGTRPRIPEIPGLEGTPYITSDEALRLPTQPRRMVIMGGGFVSAELAHFFGNLGTEVSIVQRSERLLGNEDDDISRRFTDVYSRKFDVSLKSDVQRVGYSGNEFHLEAGFNGDSRQFVADALLIAIGRVPNTDILDVAATGVDTDEHGFVKTDEYLETNVKGIWALGDIVGKFMLRHNSNLEAAHVAHNVMHPDDPIAVDHHGMPHAVFASPQVAGAGLTEAQARNEGRDIRVGTADYTDVTYGISLRDNDGFVKLIADAESDELLGCHIIGTDASILVQEAVNVIRHHLPAGVMAQSIYIHPALPEVMHSAAMALE